MNKKLTRRILTSLLSLTALCLLVAGMSCTTWAAAKKVKVAAFTAGQTTASQAAGSALTVKKGTTSIKVKEGFIKFKAPKTAVYSFTFSKLSQKNGQADFVSAECLQKGDSGLLVPAILRTKINRQVKGLLVMNDALYQVYMNNEKYVLDKPDLSNTTVTGKIKLKKNQVLYFHLSSYDRQWHTLNVKVK